LAPLGPDLILYYFLKHFAPLGQLEKGAEILSIKSHRLLIHGANEKGSGGAKHF
jgi:hypothetical protein